MENIHLDVAEGPVLSFNNSKDIEVKDLVYARNGEQKVRVSGSRNRNIKIKGGKFCIDDVLFTPKAKKAITID
jgi:phage FluMu gp28-like protein